MASIYRGHQTSLSRTVAIKFLSAEFLWDDKVKQLFDQESLVIAQLNHPNIVHIIDRGFSTGNRPYFVMEYIEGQNLEAKMRQSNMTTMVKVHLMMQTCQGLAFAHGNGVIHRDIKPANLLIDSEGYLKILDFGIAWLNAKGSPDGQEIVGTPDYMSPEQFSSPDSVSPLSDIYSLGAVMYHLFTGKKQSSNIQNWPAALDALRSDLAELVRQCLQTDPAMRPRTADEVKLRLLRILQGAHLGKTQREEAKSVVDNTIDNFALLDVIKRNKYGAVYLFEDKSRNQLLVIKKRTKSNSGFREARWLSHIKHPNIVKVHGTSRNDNAFIVVMQHLTGGSLQDRLSRPYPENQFIEIAVQLCSAMQAAHHHNILHGDLRPNKILFDDKEQIRVTDFGFEDHYQANRKVQYQPLSGGKASIGGDIYSAGAIFYHLLTGKPPVLTKRGLQPSRAFEKLDIRLQKLLRSMLETDSNGPVIRFDQIIPTLKALKGKLPDSKIPAKRPVRFTVWHLLFVVTLLILLAFSTYLYLNTELLTMVIPISEN
jgi:serine/threonine protein kinase